jgi:hypothetical protein
MHAQWIELIPKKNTAFDDGRPRLLPDLRREVAHAQNIVASEGRGGLNVKSEV